MRLILRSFACLGQPMRLENEKMKQMEEMRTLRAGVLVLWQCCCRLQAKRHIESMVHIPTPLFFAVVGAVLFNATATAGLLIPFPGASHYSPKYSARSPSVHMRLNLAPELDHRQRGEQSLSESVSDHGVIQSVNFHISRRCNYQCKFCFHTQKNSHYLPLEKAKYGLRLLHNAGTQKINFAGGEPFLHPLHLGDLCQYASQELGMAVSIISNGSLITEEWMKYYGNFVDVLGVSLDSFDEETNNKIGRRASSQRSSQQIDQAQRVREWCDHKNIKFKLNTVVCKHNWQEDMVSHLQKLDPFRWKVFQVLILEGENTGSGALREARDLVVTSEQFQAFLHRHEPYVPSLVPEDNSAMQSSYLMLDEEMRFLDCSEGSKVPGKSILEVGVWEAVQQANFDNDMFQKRGGVYDWTRKRSALEGKVPLFNM